MKKSHTDKPSESTKPKGPRTILIADDHPSLLKMMEVILVSAGWHVVKATNGTEALKLARETHPVLAILDLVMPQLDARQICQILTSDPETADIPVLVLTSIGDAEVEKHCMEAGASAFLSKPIDRKLLLAVVSDLVRNSAPNAATNHLEALEESPVRVLVIADSEMVGLPLCIELKRAGFDVKSASNALQAIEFARGHFFDVAIAELGMPQIDGIKLTWALKHIAPVMPVFLISCGPTSEQKSQASEAGVHGWIDSDYSDFIEEVLNPIRKATKQKKTRITSGSEHGLGEMDDRYPSESSWVIDSRFGKIALWSGLVTHEQLQMCLEKQEEIRSKKGSAPQIGEIMVSHGFLAPYQVEAVLKVQSIRSPLQEEVRFGQIAIGNGFAKREHLEECLQVQNDRILSGRSAPFIGQLLLERGYISEHQVMSVLRLQFAYQRGLLYDLYVHEIKGGIARARRRRSIFPTDQDDERTRN